MLISLIRAAPHVLQAQRRGESSSNDRRQLRDAAKQLHINEFLGVTPDATFRGEQAERERARTIEQ